MAIDWDAELLGPVMAVFGEGQATDPSLWPLYRTAPGGPAFQVPGAVYDEAYHQVIELADGTTQTSAHPVLGVRAAVFRNAGLLEPAQGAIIYIPSADKLYTVSDVRPDSHGHILLILIEAAV